MNVFLFSVNNAQANHIKFCCALSTQIQLILGRKVIDFDRLNCGSSYFSPVQSLASCEHAALRSERGKN